MAAGDKMAQMIELAKADKAAGVAKIPGLAGVDRMYRVVK